MATLQWAQIARPEPGSQATVMTSRFLLRSAGRSQGSCGPPWRSAARSDARRGRWGSR
jgi:hypothetical protein